MWAPAYGLQSDHISSQHHRTELPQSWASHTLLFHRAESGCKEKAALSLVPWKQCDDGEWESRESTWGYRRDTQLVCAGPPVVFGRDWYVTGMLKLDHRACLCHLVGRKRDVRLRVEWFYQETELYSSTRSECIFAASRNKLWRKQIGDMMTADVSLHDRVWLMLIWLHHRVCGVFRIFSDLPSLKRNNADLTWGFRDFKSSPPSPLSIVLSKMTCMNREFFDKHQGQTSVSLKGLLNCNRAVGAQLRWPVQEIKQCFNSLYNGL